MLISQENNVTLFCFMLLILFIFFTFHFRMKCNLKIFSREWERKKKKKKPRCLQSLAGSLNTSNILLKNQEPAFALHAHLRVSANLYNQLSQRSLFKANFHFRHSAKSGLQCLMI